MYTKTQRMTLLGEKTPQAIIYKHESHKLHQAFNVKDGDTIIQGMPVKLNEDGTISPYEGTGLFIGIAITDSITPAYPQPSVEVTVMVEGFVIVYGKAAAAITATSALKPGAAVEDDIYIPYSPDSAATDPKFIALNVADADELVQVLVK